VSDKNASPALLDRLVLGALPYVPTSLMRRFSARYIAGEELSDALEKLAALASEGYPGIVDILGEHVKSAPEAREVLDDYKVAADSVAARKLDAYVSVKPTHFGLGLSEALALELYDDLAGHCAGLGLRLRVEMEDHPTTDATLRVFEELRKRHENVGVVLQARLFRTLADIDALAPGRLDVRLVKGIYLEPPAIAHVGVEEIRRAYVECTERLFERGAFIGLATHDAIMAAELERVLARRRIAHDGYEFQVLLGVREPLWSTWKDLGHTVRVYVPFGPEWRAYSLRRLRKNPQLLRAIVRNTFRW
jgi:proline dehydrogenase